MALDGDVLPLPQTNLCNYKLIDVVKRFEFTGPRTSISCIVTVPVCLGSLQLQRVVVHEKVSHVGSTSQTGPTMLLSGRKGPALCLSLEKAEKVQQVSSQNALQPGAGTVPCESAGHQHQPLNQQRKLWANYCLIQPGQLKKQ